MAATLRPVSAFFVFFLVMAPFGYGVQVRSVSVVSNTRTRLPVIIQEITVRTNTEYSDAELSGELSNSVQNLRNLGVFSSVTADVRSDAGGADIVFTVPDRWTLFPIPFYFFDNKIGHTIGFLFNDMNLFGFKMILETRLLYESVPDWKEFSISLNYPKMIGSPFTGRVEFGYRDFIDLAYSGPDVTYSARTFDWSAKFKILYRLPGVPLSLGGQTESRFLTNDVWLNMISKNPDNSTRWYVSAGAEYGVLNRDFGMVWGDKHNLWIGISPLTGLPQAKLLLSQFWTVAGKSTLGYRLQAWISPGAELILESMNDIRGIKPGEARGDYLLFGSVEFRPYVSTLTWPMELAFLVPVFADFGLTSPTPLQFGTNSFTATAGLGLRFYPRDIGGSDSALRIDFGFNIPNILKGYGFWDCFYFAFDFDELIS